MTRTVLQRAELCDAPEVVAPRLLNTVVVVGQRLARVVEVEAYGSAEDPASHCHRGRTARNASMFRGPGHLYVYRSYGMHWCANVVTGAQGDGAAVLLRAAEIIGGIEQVRADRPGITRQVDLANGPGKLCAALGIDGDDDGLDLLAPDARIQLVRDDTLPDPRPVTTCRVGISRAVELPWRFHVPDDVSVSRGRPAHVV